MSTKSEGTESNTNVDKVESKQLGELPFSEQAAERDAEEKQKKLNESLYETARYGLVKQVKEFLADGADVNYQNENKDGDTPLIVASQWGHTEVIRVLLKNHADPTISNKVGWTPLIYASAVGQTNVVRVLLDHQSDPNMSTKYGYTPLHLAGNKDVAQCLIDNGANVSALTKNGDTIVHTASRHGNVDTLEYFISMGGLSLDTVNMSNETPITILNSLSDEWDRKQCIKKLKDLGYYKDPNDSNNVSTEPKTQSKGNH